MLVGNPWAYPARAGNSLTLSSFHGNGTPEVVEEGLSGGAGPDENWGPAKDLRVPVHDRHWQTHSPIPVGSSEQLQSVTAVALRIVECA